MRCLAVLLAYYALERGAYKLLGIRISFFYELTAMVLAIHFSAWCFVDTLGRDLLHSERLRLLWGCLIAVWLCDAGRSLVLTMMDELSWHPEVPRLTIAMRVLSRSPFSHAFDFALVGIVVWWTVPWATRGWARMLAPRAPVLPSG